MRECMEGKKREGGERESQVSREIGVFVGSAYAGFFFSFFKKIIFEILI